MGIPPPTRSGRSGLVRRFLGWLLGLLPGPPDDEEAGDPLLANLDALPPVERQARLRAWQGKFRRGRGDSADG